MTKTAKTQSPKTQSPKTRNTRAAEAQKSEDQTIPGPPPVRLHPKHERYSHREEQTASGRAVYDNGDQVAAMFRSLGLDAQYAKAAEILALAYPDKPGNSEDELRAKYRGKNPGMQRMNLGNRVRGALRQIAKRKEAEAKAKAKAKAAK